MGMRNGIENENWDGRLGLGIRNWEWDSDRELGFRLASKQPISADKVKDQL